jgi:hypothetical protein
VKITRPDESISDEQQIGLLSPVSQQSSVRRWRGANRRFEFHKRRQLFICSHNETLSVAAMCVNNPDCSRTN